MMWAALILAAPAALPGVGTAARPFGVRPAASPRMSTAEQASAAAAVDAPTNVPAWLETYRTTPAEESYTVECAALPADLKGTLYRNGPSKFEIGDSPVVHPFDGDGMLAALTFDGEGRVHFRNRFVRTRGFVLEEREGKRLFANAFGNPLPAWSGGLSVRGHRRRPAVLRRARASAAHAGLSRPAAARSPRTWRTRTCCTGAAGCSRCGRPASRT